MNRLAYSVWRWHDRSATFGNGGNQQWDIQIRALAKASPTNPFEVANEILALRLGTILGLPIPLGVTYIDEDDGGKLHYLSLHVAIAGEDLPIATDADIEAIQADNRLACGIIVFDAWILNADRIKKNISYDEELRQTYIYDHGRALFAGQRAEMEKNKDGLGIRAEEKHCLSGIKSLLWFNEWHHRIMDLPVTYIRDSVELASHFGLPESDVDYVTEYLLNRRSRLRELFRAHRSAEFTELNDGLFDPLEPDMLPTLNDTGYVI
jgi:hypothetical protein